MISVSFYNVKNNIEKVIDNINKTNADFIHVDIADNIFVNNKSIDDNILYLPLKNSKKKKDVHLMVKDIKKYIDLYKIFNPEYITFHLEATDSINEMINYIKSFNIKVGLSINPKTDVEKLIPYLNRIDLVLLMSVEPGYGGQRFINDTLNKISKLKEYKKENNFLIEVDGGINDTNIDKLKDVDILVVGSYITNSDNYQDKIDSIKKNF